MKKIKLYSHFMTDFKRYKVKYIILYLKKIEEKNAEMKIIFFFRQHIINTWLKLL